jgi:GT2 family glycosyltransferase
MSDMTSSQIKPMPAVVAIVVTYNRLAKLQECLDCLSNQSVALDVVVVDNASTDGTDTWMQEGPYADRRSVHYLKLTENSGGAGGFVRGMEWALPRNYDWFWLLDDDAMAAPDALQNLLQARQSADKSCAVLASKVVDASGALVSMNRQATYDAGRGTLYGIPDEPFAGEPFLCDSSSFVGFLVRTSVVREVGLPREDFFIHFDDVEYSLRIRRNWQIFVVSSSVIVHKITRMGHDTGKTPARDLWKLYYNRRNELFMSLRYTKGSRAKLFFLGRRVVKLGGRTVKSVYRDHPMLRIAIEWRAFIDGLTGRLGKRIDPAAFNKRLTSS